MVEVYDILLKVSMITGASNLQGVGRFVHDKQGAVLAMAVLIEIGRAIKEVVTVCKFARSNVRHSGGAEINAAVTRVVAKCLVTTASKCTD